MNVQVKSRQAKSPKESESVITEWQRHPLAEQVIESLIDEVLSSSPKILAWNDLLKKQPHARFCIF